MRNLFWYILVGLLLVGSLAGCEVQTQYGSIGSPNATPAAQPSGNQGQTGGGAPTQGQAQPTVAQAPSGAQSSGSTYVGVPPENAATGPAPANDIGLAILDGVTYQFDGGARRWFGTWQTGKPQSQPMAGVPFQVKVKASCQTGGWRLFADSVSLAMAGNSVLTENPGIVEVLCPFEETEFVVKDGQLGFVPAEWADWAWNDRVIGFQKASGHSATNRRYRFDPGSRKLERIG